MKKEELEVNDRTRDADAAGHSRVTCHASRSMTELSEHIEMLVLFG